MASSEAFGSGQKQPDDRRVYTQEDIQNILGLAIAQHAYQGEFSRSQLFDIASDLGIADTLIRQAEQTWLQSSSERSKRDAFNEHQRAELKRKVVRFAIVNIGLISLNALMGFGFPWSLYLLTFGGLFLGLKAWNVFHLDGEAYEKAFQRWNRHRQVRTVMNRWLDRWLSA